MRHKGVNYAKYGYIFCIPFILAFLFFSFYPIVYTTVIGFTDLKGMGRTDFTFLENPFQNFITILNNGSFRQSLKNTIIIWITNFIPQRSEEHTSELQSRPHLVCRLLLEKKKKK